MSDQNLDLCITVRGHDPGLKLFDYLHAARIKIQNRALAIRCSASQDPDCDISVLFVAFDGAVESAEVDQHDVVIFSNHDEPLIKSNDQIAKYLPRQNCYMVCNSYTMPDHVLHPKIIWTTVDPLTTRQYWLNPTFPHYHEHHVHRRLPRSRPMIFVNGQNRSWRHHYVSLIMQLIPEMPVMSNYAGCIHETNDAYWETVEDRRFRDTVNSIYPVTRNRETGYYDQALQLSFLDRYDGLPSKATVAPGYSIIPAYYQHWVVVFPETNWLNDELSPTEKILKCFFARTLPFPIGGANINHLYNELGFQTAWNLLPEHLQGFDHEKDHAVRADHTVSALQWLWQHPEIYHGDRYQQIIEHNYVHFLSNSIDCKLIEQMQQLLHRVWSEKSAYRQGTRHTSESHST